MDCDYQKQFVDNHSQLGLTTRPPGTPTLTMEVAIQPWLQTCRRDAD
jgi:hypothetical protein